MLSAIAIIIMQFLIPLTLVVFLLGIIQFVYTNQAEFKKAKAYALGMVLPVAIMIPVISNVAKNSLYSSSEISMAATVISYVCFFGLVISYAISMRKRLLVDYLQPLVLRSSALVLIIVGSVLSFVLCTVALFCGQTITPGLTIVVFTVFDLVLSAWVSTRKMQEFENVEFTANVFENGECDYSTFRLPVILAVDKAEIAKTYDIELENDPIFAFAEGRKASSKDLGNIDILLKVSTNNGKTWSALKMLLTLGDVDGKMGNPTVVFDKVNGKFIFVYLQAKKENKYEYETFCVRGTLTEELDIIFDEPSLMEIEKVALGKNHRFDGVTLNTLMPGPGKGVQVKGGEHDGRLIMPFSNRGAAFIMYSDDYGYTWAKTGEAGLGNECEITQIDSGEIIMVSRDGRGCTGKHKDCYQKLSYSNDAGETWFETDYQTELPTPICMTSIQGIDNDGLYLSYPHDHLTRCNLSVAKSTDQGRSFEAKTIYSGPAGYSCLTTNTSGELFCMAEVGKVDYNEALIFVKVSK